MAKVSFKVSKDGNGKVAKVCGDFSSSQLTAIAQVMNQRRYSSPPPKASTPSKSAKSSSTLANAKGDEGGSTNTSLIDTLDVLKTMGCGRKSKVISAFVSLLKSGKLEGKLDGEVLVLKVSDVETVEKETKIPILQI